MVHICRIICCAVISYFDLILVILISFCRLLLSGYICYMYFAGVAFSALTLLVGWQEKTKRVVGYWSGYLSGARCRLAYGPDDATATHGLLLQ